jgi:xylulokinase
VPSRRLVAGVDSSTQSTKVELRDIRTGELVAHGRAPHPPTTPPVSEQHPDDWWDALVAATAGCGAARDEVVALSVAAQQHGLVLLDEDGAVLRPAPLWNDTTSATEAAALVERLGPAEWATACGSVPVASFTITKLARIAATEPAVLSRVARVALPHDELTRRLTGRLVTDRGDVSGTGWWSPTEGRSRPDLLRLATAVADPAWLPEVLGPAEPAGPLLAAPAGELGLPPGITVGAGTGDNMAAALGLALRPGDVMLSLGTSGTVSTVSESPTQDPTGAVAGFADASGRFLPLVCTLNAMRVTDTVAHLLGVAAEDLDDLVASAPLGSGGLTFLPYLDGERTPDRPEATGEVVGLRTTTGPASLARAAVEGVVCGLLDGLDALNSTLAAAPEGDHLLVGGGARSAAYREVLAVLSGRSWLAVTGDETVARGAAAQAAATVDGVTVDEVLDRWGRPATITTTSEPGAARSSAAAEVRARYDALRDRS